MKHPDGTVIEIPLPSKSLLIMTEDSRLLWRYFMNIIKLLISSHGINSRKTDTMEGIIVQREKRISITFRKVNFGIFKLNFYQGKIFRMQM